MVANRVPLLLGLDTKCARQHVVEMGWQRWWGCYGDIFMLRVRPQGKMLHQTSKELISILLDSCSLLAWNVALQVSVRGEHSTLWFQPFHVPVIEQNRQEKPLVRLWQAWLPSLISVLSGLPRLAQWSKSTMGIDYAKCAAINPNPVHPSLVSMYAYLSSRSSHKWGDKIEQTK